MSDDIGVQITGARRFELRFDEFPKELRADFVAEITKWTERLHSAILGVVRRKSGRLAGQIEAQVYKDNPERVAGYVRVDGQSGRDFAKAGALEWGGTGDPFAVNAHSMRLGHFWAHQLTSPLQVMVDAHERVVTTPAQKFMRGPFEALRAEMEASLRAVVAKKAKGASD